MTHVILSCLHDFYSTVKPRHNDTVWCMRCGNYSEYVERLPEWSAQCGSCHRLKSVNGELSADTKAASHAVRLPGHVVDVTRDGEVVKTYRHDPPTLGDDPPF